MPVGSPAMSVLSGMTSHLPGTRGRSVGWSVDNSSAQRRPCFATWPPDARPDAPNSLAIGYLALSRGFRSAYRLMGSDRVWLRAPPAEKRIKKSIFNGFMLFVSERFRLAVWSPIAVNLINVVIVSN